MRGRRSTSHQTQHLPPGAITYIHQGVHQRVPAGIGSSTPASPLSGSVRPPSFPVVSVGIRMLDLQRPSGELSESELLFDAASDADLSSAGLPQASALTAAFAKDAASLAKSGISMGHLHSSLSCTSQAVSTASQQVLLSKAVSGVGGAGRSGFLPPHLHDALGTSSTVDPRFSSTSALDTPFRPGSVTQGKGRRLAGLDQARFRNAVMRQTGFLEPESQ